MKTFIWTKIVHVTDLERRPVLRKPSPEKMSGFEAWQWRAGRAAADISIQKLADLSGVSISSIRRAEDNGSAPMSRVNQKALLDALAGLGVTLSAPEAGPATVMMTVETAQTPTTRAEAASSLPATRASGRSRQT